MNQADKNLMMKLARQWLREFNSQNPDRHPQNVLELHPFRNTLKTSYNYIDMFQAKPKVPDANQELNDDNHK